MAEYVLALNLRVRPRRRWIIEHEFPAIDFWIWYLRAGRLNYQRI